MSDSVTNGSRALTPVEGRFLDRLRKLSSEAVQRVEDYLSLLEAHSADSGKAGSHPSINPAEELSSEAFGRVVRELPPAAALSILEFATFLAGRHLRWSYDDPSSLDRAPDLMGLDPFV